MKDIIYREDVLDEIGELTYLEYVDVAYVELEKHINSIPSAERTGNWIWENYT